MTTLSILVPSVHTRHATFAPQIQTALYGQYETLPPQDQDRVEIIMLTDTKTIPLGDKRNRMVELASGDYVAFVDDDDRLEDDYLSTLLAGIDESGADVVTFRVSVTLDGGPPQDCVYSKNWHADHNTPTEYRRLPNHICAVRRRIVLECPFPSVWYGEDADYARRLQPLLTTEHAIDRVLYHYDYDSCTTETQNPANRRDTRDSAIVDVVILSKADTPELQAMTQRAVDSCRAGARGHVVNVIVVEQAPGVRHRGAHTLHNYAPFAYNQFANQAARTGRAPWVMVANNDLEFENGWLDHLLAAGHPVVSPHNPGDPRQHEILTNTTGTTNGRHFSGWCFMLTRALWDTIGGLDEDFTFWCADDAVIEQVKAFGVDPMLVPAARVRHLVSRTARGSDDTDGAMTWAQVHRFEQKYGVPKFQTDARYAAWKTAHGVTS